MPGLSVVNVLSFNLQLFLASLTNPVMLSFDEGVVVNPRSIVFRAKIAFHKPRSRHRA